MLSQAITENMQVISSDELFDKYHIDLVKVDATAVDALVPGTRC